MTDYRSARMAQAAEFADIAEKFRDLADEWENRGSHAAAGRCRDRAVKYDAFADKILAGIDADEVLPQALNPRPRRSWLAAAVDLVRQRLGFRLR